MLLHKEQHKNQIAESHHRYRERPSWWSWTSAMASEKGEKAEKSEKGVSVVMWPNTVAVLALPPRISSRSTSLMLLLVKQDWRNKEGISNEEICTSCVRASTCAWQTLENVTCATCCGDGKSPVRVTATQRVPKIRDGNVEEYKFEARGICSSSRIHMQVSSLCLVVNLRSQVLISTPFQIQSRPCQENFDVVRSVCDSNEIDLVQQKQQLFQSGLPVHPLQPQTDAPRAPPSPPPLPSSPQHTVTEETLVQSFPPLSQRSPNKHHIIAQKEACSLPSVRATGKRPPQTKVSRGTVRPNNSQPRCRVPQERLRMMIPPPQDHHNQPVTYEEELEDTASFPAFHSTPPYPVPMAPTIPAYNRFMQPAFEVLGDTLPSDNDQAEEYPSPDYQTEEINPYAAGIQGYAPPADYSYLQEEYENYAPQQVQLPTRAHYRPRLQEDVPDDYGDTEEEFVSNQQPQYMPRYVPMVPLRHRHDPVPPHLQRAVLSQQAIMHEENNLYRQQQQFLPYSPLLYNPYVPYHYQPRHHRHRHSHRHMQVRPQQPRVSPPFAAHPLDAAFLCRVGGPAVVVRILLLAPQFTSYMAVCSAHYYYVTVPRVPGYIGTKLAKFDRLPLPQSATPAPKPVTPEKPSKTSPEAEDAKTHNSKKSLSDSGGVPNQTPNRDNAHSQSLSREHQQKHQQQTPQKPEQPNLDLTQPRYRVSISSYETTFCAETGMNNWELYVTNGLKNVFNIDLIDSGLLVCLARYTNW
ncbi:hypothetical protein Pelo_13777 [Pelomyxa schiedti]|nr:hypothetical protein Pelo_13777 [Pelomyxa schiedti]